MTRNMNKVMTQNSSKVTSKANKVLIAKNPLVNGFLHGSGIDLSHLNAGPATAIDWFGKRQA
jgi:hypothetical protein